ncbi:MAG: integration host factor subunit beta [Kiritimatiellae bacterium]|nr:integration host factor subunit beta [Kiritimatiellia bacterium]
MTKKHLVEQLAKDFPGLTQQQLAGILQRILDYMIEALKQGRTIEFRNFGVFEVQTRKPRVGRNPNRPSQVVQIPMRKVVKFKPGRIMRRDITGR